MVNLYLRWNLPGCTVGLSLTKANIVITILLESHHIRNSEREVSKQLVYSSVNAALCFIWEFYIPERFTGAECASGFSLNCRKSVQLWCSSNRCLNKTWEGRLPLELAVKRTPVFQA